jgi:hydroxymethylpyrimidine pyrophosphatase-like HAD family hydrolase
MRWRALATDFDGTLATEGFVAGPAKLAMEKLRAGGVQVVLVTGRELKDFAGLDVPLSHFDLVVAENGAVLYDPKTREVRGLGPPPPEHLISELVRLGVTPLSIGASIVATCEPYEHVVLELIKTLGLEHQVIFNKGAVMILPPGVNKASGLRSALEQLRIDPADTVAVGDAENDHALLEMCGLAVAVANAIPSLKEQAHWVTTAPNGAGVRELMDAMRHGDLDHAGGPKEIAS